VIEGGVLRVGDPVTVISQVRGSAS